MSLTVLSALRWWARETPEVTAVTVADRAVTYAELQRRGFQIAAVLAQRGIAKGDRIAVLADPSIEYCALGIAAQMLGALIAPMNIRMTAAELSVALTDTRPRMLFSDAARADLAGRATPIDGVAIFALEEIDRWRDDDPRFVPYEATADDLLAIPSTSGSTAKPKFVKFSHRMVVSIAAELAIMEPSCRQGAKCVVLSPFFSGGYYVWLEYLVLGCSQFLQTHFDADEAIRMIERERINIMPATPVHWQRMRESRYFADADFSSLKWTTIGGARISRELLDAWKAKGVTLRPLFGQTEAGGAWAARGVAIGDPRQAGYGGVFTEFRIAGQDGGFASAGEEGEILVRGPSVTSGYWQAVEASAELFRDGWLRTGDVGRVDDIGSLTYIDRIKDIVISGGLNISSAEVEHVIGEMPGVEEVAVISAPDQRFGETPMAVIYAKSPLDPRAVVAHCNARLADYKVPRYVVCDASPLPRLASGKISKPQLRQQYAHTVAELPRLR